MYADRNSVDTAPDIHILQKRLLSLIHACGGPVLLFGSQSQHFSSGRGNFRSICDSLAIVEHAGTLRDSADDHPGGLRLERGKQRSKEK